MDSVESLIIILIIVLNLTQAFLLGLKIGYDFGNKPEEEKPK